MPANVPPIDIAPGVRNVNPVVGGAWSSVSPKIKDFLINHPDPNYRVNPDGSNFSKLPASMREAAAKYTAPVFQQMVSGGRFNAPNRQNLQQQQAKLVMEQINKFNQDYPKAQEQYASFKNIPEDLRLGITQTMGLTPEGYDNPNSYYARVLRSQIAAAAMGTPAGQDKYKLLRDNINLFAQNPQRIQALHNNINWNPANGGSWMKHELDTKPAPAQNVGANNPQQAPPPPMNPPMAPPMNQPMNPPMNPAPKPDFTPGKPPGFKPAPNGNNKQGSAMTEKQIFKLAFITKCIEDGLSVEEMAIRAKQALYFREKNAGMEKKAWLAPALTGLGVGASYLGGKIIDAGSATAGAAADLAKHTVSTLGPYFINPLTHYGLAGGVPLALGYYLAGPAAYNAFSKPNLPSREELLRQELQNEYEKQTDMLKKQTEMAKRRKERSKGISGVTRF